MTPAETALLVVALVWAAGIVVFCVAWHRARTPFRRSSRGGGPRV